MMCPDAVQAVAAGSRGPRRIRLPGIDFFLENS